MNNIINLSFLSAAAVFCICVAAEAAPAVTPGQDMKAPIMRAFGESTPPFGYVGFCAKNPKDCAGGSRKPRRMSLDKSRWAELNKINTYVNRSVRPTTDQELYKTIEKWAYPYKGAGDCEDYVLQKRKMLVTRGWPAESLLITVAIDKNNGGHAVLTVVTDRGDLILDNQEEGIQRWNKTPYRYHKRQSQFHPSVWVSLTPNARASTITSTRKKRR